MRPSSGYTARWTYVHRETLAGMNAGVDIYPLMQDDQFATRVASGSGLRQGGLGSANNLGNLHGLVSSAVINRALPGNGVEQQ